MNRSKANNGDGRCSSIYVLGSDYETQSVAVATLMIEDTEHMHTHNGALQKRCKTTTTKKEAKRDESS